MKQQVKQAILRALRDGPDGAMTDGVVKGFVRSSFPGVAFTEGDLSMNLRELEGQLLIVGARDELIGTVWALTPKGRLAALQL